MLVKRVVVFDARRNLHVFGPGDEVPAWARDLITNPSVWDTSTPVKDDEETGPPPKAGKGSGEPRWREYAAKQGVDVSSAEGRDDIIDALRDAGVPVE